VDQENIHRKNAENNQAVYRTRMCMTDPFRPATDPPAPHTLQQCCTSLQADRRKKAGAEELLFERSNKRKEKRALGPVYITITAF